MYLGMRVPVEGLHELLLCKSKESGGLKMKVLLLENLNVFKKLLNTSKEIGLLTGESFNFLFVITCLSLGGGLLSLIRRKEEREEKEGES